MEFRCNRLFTSHLQKKIGRGRLRYLRLEGDYLFRKVRVEAVKAGEYSAPMRRFILRYQGKGEAPQAEAEDILRRSGARLVDASSRMLLIDAEESDVRGLEEKLRDWVVIPESTVPLPDPRQRIRNKAS